MVRPLLSVLTLVAALALALLPVPAQAWGLLGHRLVALLAWDDLAPDTRRQIDALLQGEPDPTLAGIAGWAARLLTRREQAAALWRPNLGLSASAGWANGQSQMNGAQFSALKG